MASSSLVTRLKELQADKKIEAYEIYDATRIENRFHNIGLSGVLLQHLPVSHTDLRPIHPLVGKYQALPCEMCGKDLLKSSVKRDTLGNITFATRLDDKDTNVIESVHFVCKGACDRGLEDRLHQRGLMTGWDDIADYCNPLIFMRRTTGYMNQMRNDPASYSKAAHDRLIEFYITVSQRTLRQTTDEDRQSLMEAMKIDEFGF